MGGRAARGGADRNPTTPVEGAEPVEPIEPVDRRLRELLSRDLRARDLPRYRRPPTVAFTVLNIVVGVCAVLAGLGLLLAGSFGLNNGQPAGVGFVILGGLCIGAARLALAIRRRALDEQRSRAD